MKKREEHRRLREIAKSKGFKVRSGKSFTIYFLSALITIDNRVGPNQWTWKMLHEMGHGELIMRRERMHMNTLLRMLNMPRYSPTDAFFRDYLKMEWKAWEQGLKIAKREGIKVNEKQYWRHAKKSYQTYVDNLRSHYE